MPSLIFSVRRRPRRRLPFGVWFAAATLAVGVAASCSGSTDPVALIDNVTYHSALFALNGSEIGEPSAIDTPVAETVRPDATYVFDVAFDLDSLGQPLVLTQRKVGVPLGTTGHQVSLQSVSGTFDALVQAPSDGYAVDSLLTVTVGQVFVVRAAPADCSLQISPYIYSKMVVDSINLAARRLWVTSLTDPNCGFRDVFVGRAKH